ncbi:MAG: hypothetical protein ACK53W_05720 [Gemmatimonadota bacterium]
MRPAAACALGLLTVGTAGAFPAAVRAQVRTLSAIPASDSIVLIVAGRLPYRFGFRVERRASPAGPATGAGEWRPVYPGIVRAVREPADAIALIGDRMETVQLATGALVELEAIRRLEVDAGLGTLLSALVPAVGRVTARRLVDTAVAPGAAYEYRVTVLGPDDAPDGSPFLRRAVAAPLPTPSVTALAARTSRDAVTLTWRYPEFADGADAVLGFRVLRQVSGDSARTPLTILPVLRTAKQPYLFVDRDVIGGSRYTYLVVPVDGAGVEPGGAARIGVAFGDREPPPVPREVVTQPGQERVRVVWAAAPTPDVAGYVVERSVGGTRVWTRLTRGTIPRDVPEFTDTVARAGDVYFYRVAAVDSAGNLGPFTSGISATPYDAEPPSPPTGVTVTAARRRVTVRWTPSTTPGDRGAYIYRGPVGQPDQQITAVAIRGGLFIDSSSAVVPGRRLVYRVVALDRFYNQSKSPGDTVQVPDDEPPAPPGPLVATVRPDGSVELRVTASASLDVAAYELARERGPQGSVSVPLGRLPVGAPLVARDSGLRIGDRAVYRVTAIDSAGNRSAPIRDSVSLVDNVPPSPPRFAAATLQPGGVRVEWERVVHPRLAGYHVYRSTAAAGGYGRITRAPVTALQFVDPAGTAASFYVVRAVDVAGHESDPSPWARAERRP